MAGTQEVSSLLCGSVSEWTVYVHIHTVLDTENEIYFENCCRKRVMHCPSVWSHKWSSIYAACRLKELFTGQSNISIHCFVLQWMHQDAFGVQWHFNMVIIGGICEQATVPAESHPDR